MRQTLMFSTLLLAAAAGVVSAQPRPVYERSAEIRGQRGDEGKCTIEVDVDDVAEVEIRGDRAWLRTLAGQPATWRRFQCTGALPRNPADFRFQGIDGRGRVNLIQDPRSSGGRAVVRIEDSRGGREGYTFDLIWRGFEGGGPIGGGPIGGGPIGGGPVVSRPDPGRPGWGGGRWNRDVDFRGRGEGFYRNNRGANDRLYNCEVDIRRHGDVRVSFETNANTTLTFSGRITNVEGDRITADMSGHGVVGGMVIDLDRDRVRQVNMSGEGRMRFELRWRH